MTTFDLGTMIDDIISTPARLQAERDLRMAAEERARTAEARVAELEATAERFETWLNDKDGEIRQLRADYAAVDEELRKYVKTAMFFYDAFVEESAKGLTTSGKRS